ncbi:MAG: Glycerate 2-kinase [Planctomycetes bacterium ADurb.Bin126]|mgnify:CR=1 FL=1|nr:MAG: Glycerate 2-kinase [Planctomycetes bacterium ADurb.Bin126]HOD83120.1 glycerate kinase [Phycisphaerae bacterium]HQL72467.1 glycerate kinase [Phycisphaerae bacterium]
MKVVIAPDKFKECLPASAVAEAMAQGVLDVCPQAVIDLCPMADGGDGTVEAMVAATGGQMVSADVFDPLGKEIRARFALLGEGAQPVLPGELGLAAALTGGGEVAEGATAVIEMAAASGMALVPPERRDPTRTTTFGTGQLILAALDAGARRIIVGLGGSATVDGGAGAVQALGVTFIGADGQPCRCGLSGGQLTDIRDADLGDLDPRVRQACIEVACDVTNPLIGPRGAAAVYAPQKGATPEMVIQLEAALTHWAELTRRTTGVDIAAMSGAGAAGGLGAGLAAYAGASLTSGVQVVAKAVGLRRRLAEADLCITGEGKLDDQSLSGKTTVGVARMAKEYKLGVLCVAGQAQGLESDLFVHGALSALFDRIQSLVGQEVTVPLAMRRAGELIRLRTAQALRDYLAS